MSMIIKISSKIHKNVKIHQNWSKYPRNFTKIHPNWNKYPRNFIKNPIKMLKFIEI